MIEKTKKCLLKPETVAKRADKLRQQMLDIKQEIIKVQARCSHEGRRSFSPDPSGNNDSYYYCDVCNKAMR